MHCPQMSVEIGLLDEYFVAMDAQIAFIGMPFYMPVIMYINEYRLLATC